MNTLRPLNTVPNPERTNVMVDLETTGLRPDRNAIIQIAAAKFDPVARRVESIDMFNRCLIQPNERPPDYDTLVNFWGRNQSVYNRIVQKAEPVDQVLMDFVRWVGYDGAILWAKPSHFEHQWLESYFADYKIPTPFHYRNTQDLYSYLRGLFGVHHVDDLPSGIIDLPLEGDAHDAMFDVLHQVAVLFRALDIKEGKL